MNKTNNQILKNQIELKKNISNNNMSDQEYLLNRELIQKAANTINEMENNN